MQSIRPTGVAQQRQAQSRAPADGAAERWWCGSSHKVALCLVWRRPWPHGVDSMDGHMQDASIMMRIRAGVQVIAPVDDRTPLHLAGMAWQDVRTTACARVADRRCCCSQSSAKMAILRGVAQGRQGNADLAVETWRANWRCAQQARLRRYQAPNAAPSLNTQPGNPRPGLSSCTCAARATTPADGATVVLLYPSSARPRCSPSPTTTHPYLSRTTDTEDAGISIHRSRYHPVQPAALDVPAYH